MDDDEINNFIVPKIIRAVYSEIEIKRFNDPVEALKIISESPLDSETVILLDLNMPNMDGWQFLEECKNRNLNYSVFILTSSENQDDIRKAANHTLVKGYFSKPLSFENVKLMF